MRKFNIGYNERTNTYYYRNFKEIDRLPDIGDTFDGREVVDVDDIWMDCEQPYSNNFFYDLYKITCREEDENVQYYVCIEKEIEFSEEEEDETDD